jgi:hypothetical protein
VLGWFVVGRLRRADDQEPAVEAAVAAAVASPPTPTPSVAGPSSVASGGGATATRAAEPANDGRGSKAGVAAKASVAAKAGSSKAPRAPRAPRTIKTAAPVPAVEHETALPPEPEAASLTDLDASEPFAVVGPAVAVLEVPLNEAHIPRWRRPSLKAARQTSERYPTTERVAVRFETPPADGADRRQVVYRLVRVGSQPDEFAGEELGRIDRGDEVEVIDRQGAYLLVQTPDGVTGWVHRTTLRAPDRSLEDGPD